MITIMTTTMVSEENKTKVVNMQLNAMAKEKSFLDKMFFADVEKVPAKDLLPDFNFCSYNDHIVKVKSPDGNDIIVNNVSSNYLLLPNNEIFPKLEEELSKFGNVNIKREVKNYSSFFVDYIFDIPGNRIELVKNETLLPRIQIQNSYNSKHLYNVRYGLYRMVCTNGLTIPESVEDFKMSHCLNNLEDIIENTLNDVAEFLLNAKELGQRFEPLFEKKVNPLELEVIVDNILGDTKSLLSYKKEIIERIQKENAEENVEYTLWSVYNGMNYMLQPHNNPKMTASADSRMKTDQKILDYIYTMAV